MLPHRNGLALAAILAVTAAAYVPCADGDFLFDDETLLGTRFVLSPFEQPIGSWLSTSRPLTTLTFALNRLAVGVDPRGWHLASLAIHLCAVVLAWSTARRTLARAGLADPDRPALAAAVLFALHPLQSESVAYLSQRAESLASGLYLVALLLLLRRDECTPGARRRGLLLGALGVQALGLLAKPIVATLPVAWLLHAAILPAPGEEGFGSVARIRRRLGAAVPLLALSAGAAAMELRGNEGSTAAGLGIPGLGPARYLLAQFEVIPTYLRLAFVPIGQSADWDLRPPSSAGAATVLGALLLAGVVVAAVLLAVRAGRRTGDGPAAARAAAFGLLFFFVALAPSSSVVPLKDLLAEHRVYLGMLGLATGVAAAGAWIVRRWAGRGALAVGTAVVVVASAALGTATAYRAAVWTTHLALWSDAAAKAPNKARAQLNLGTALFFEQRYREALGSFRRAQALQSDGTVEPEMVLLNVVAALARLDRLEEARAAILEALVRAPGSAHALGLLAEIEFAAGRPWESERAAAGALAIDPTHPGAQKYLGKVRVGQGRLGEARALLRAAAPELPRDAGVWLDLGRVEERLGDGAAACAALGRATTAGGLGAVAAEARAEAARIGCR